MRMNIAEPVHRSHAVTALSLDKPDATRLRRWSQHKAGLTLGIGLGMSSDEDPDADGFFRIGHMGHVNAHMIMGVIGTIDAGLKSLGILHGSGATEAAAQEIASAF